MREEKCTEYRRRSVHSALTVSLNRNGSPLTHPRQYVLMEIARAGGGIDFPHSALLAFLPFRAHPGRPTSHFTQPMTGDGAGRALQSVSLARSCDLRPAAVAVVRHAASGLGSDRWVGGMVVRGAKSGHGQEEVGSLSLSFLSCRVELNCPISPLLQSLLLPDSLAKNAAFTQLPPL